MMTFNLWAKSKRSNTSHDWHVEVWADHTRTIIAQRNLIWQMENAMEFFRRKPRTRTAILRESLNWFKSSTGLDYTQWCRWDAANPVD